MLVTCAAMDLGIALNSEAISRLFTKDPDTQADVASLLRILLLIVPLDSLQTVIDGILRGLGKQALAFKVKLCCMWGVRFPLAILLGFHTGLGVRGIWWGSAAGLAATMAIYMALLLRIDWEAEISRCDAAYQRLASPASANGSTLLGRERAHSGDLMCQQFSPVPGLCRGAGPASPVVKVLDDEPLEESQA